MYLELEEKNIYFFYKNLKKKIIKNLNEKKPTPCDGCPKIQYKAWSEEIKINKISLEAHSKCNARCSYCSEMFYGGLDPNYDLEFMLNDFRKNNFFDKKVAVTWGGGEHVLLNIFFAGPFSQKLIFFFFKKTPAS